MAAAILFRNMVEHGMKWYEVYFMQMFFSVSKNYDTQ